MLSSYSYQYTTKLNSKSDNDDNNDEEWNIIVEKDEAVKKLILEEGSGDIPSQGSNVEIEYVGKLGNSQEGWSVDDVIECWLQSLQGLSDVLETPFREMNVDGKMLMDESIFTEEFVSNDLGVANKIQCKKTIMATKRLRNQIEDFPVGFEFDSSLERGKSFSFVLGKGKAIKAMDLAVATMKVGEKARVVCRSDYGYGAEGYRTAKGDVVVPPFRTLSFDIELVSSSN
jgi:FKBP-type peptidyl-prolyl cis-trans isomerase